MRPGQAIGAGLLLMLAGLCPPSAESGANQEHAADYSRTGADTCLKCHDETSEFPVLAIFQTPHGLRSDPRAPMAGLQCEACHGAGGAHTGRIRGDESRPPLPNFGPKASASIEAQNQVCLNCHQGDARTHWTGSEHAGADLSCAACHQMHARQDPVLAPERSSAVCGQCHGQQHTASLLPSAHPLRSAQMNCGDCHAAHGSVQAALLKGVTPTDTCLSCHADKRGPLLWEHAPVSEDCGLCHRPHGSNHPALLTQRAPLLCQQCHGQDGHPSLAMTGNSRPSTMSSLRSCTNCHSQVHGSNHPSGAALMR